MVLVVDLARVAFVTHFAVKDVDGIWERRVTLGRELADAEVYV